MADMGRDFLNKGNSISKGFRDSPRGFFKVARIVCIKHLDGKVTEHGPITDPWRYIKKVEKEPGVEKAWIKPE